MNIETTAQQSLEQLKATGAQKYQTMAVEKKLTEINIENSELSLMRTTCSNEINLEIIHDQKQAQLSVNKTDGPTIKSASQETFQLAQSSQKDECHDISNESESFKLESGDKEPNVEKLVKTLDNLKEKIKVNFPEIKLESSYLSHQNINKYFLNSNNVSFHSDQSYYQLFLMFTGKRGKKASSFNFTGFSMKQLEEDLFTKNEINKHLESSVKQIDKQKIPNKFEGEVIFTPECLRTFISGFLAYLKDTMMIEKSSPMLGKLGQKVTSDKLSISSLPYSSEMSTTNFFTGDGFKTQDLNILENGVLKSNLLSLYGSKKTGLERAKNYGSNIVVNAGQSSLEEMVKSTQKGIVFGRFSGGRPSPNGDFSGIAKNSFYVENGEIKYALEETMINGNIIKMLENITSISKYRNNYGDALFPYLQSSGITIS